MIYYNLIFFSISFLLLLALKHKYFFYLAFLSSIVFFGLRFEVGADWFNYINKFYQAEYMSLKDYLATSDVFFSSIAYYIYKVFGSYQALVFTMSLVFLTGVFKLIDYDRRASLLVFFILYPYLILVVGPNYIRQAAAVGFMCSSIFFFLKEENEKALLIAFICPFMHASAAIVPLLIYVSAFKITIKKATYALIVFIFLGLFVGPRLATKLNFHINEFTHEASGVYFRILIYSFPFFLYLIYREKFVNDRLGRLSKITTVTFFILVLCSLYESVIGDRLLIYTLPVQAVIVSNIYIRLYSKTDKTIFFMMIFLYSIIQTNLWLKYSLWADRAWLPYKNIITELL